MLAVNTVLTALVLENNSIRDAGATELSNALATNTVLTELDLCCNSSRALRGCDRAVHDAGDQFRADVARCHIHIR